jgi:subtilisin family serine protease
MAILSSSIIPVEKPVQFDKPRFGIKLVEVDNLVRATQARTHFSVSGHGLCAAIIDTGLNADHVDFKDRVPAQLNLTSDNQGKKDVARDGNGHGTNVGGIVVANGDHTGIAPGASIIPIKALGDEGGGSFDAVRDGLTWVLENHEKYQITSVCMSLGDSNNLDSDNTLADDDIKKLFIRLKDKKIAVIVAAGNEYFSCNGKEGMSYPAIIQECISVGAVYDDVEGKFEYGDGATAYSTAPDWITPFSQRLHSSTNKSCYTSIFAPGAPVTSSGIKGPHGESTQHGTSQAAPVTCGVVLLMQEFVRNSTGALPKVDDIVRWLGSGGVTINDGDDEDDNVVHTKKDFKRVDAVNTLSTIKREIEVKSLQAAGIIGLPGPK